MRKVTVVGAGNVGATCADALARENLVNEIVLVDIKGEMAQGKALDIYQQSPIGEYSTRIIGTDDYKYTANSDIVIITAGLPRKPGMSRDDLIAINAKIVNTVTQNILQYSERPIIIVVSNPLDVMTYAAYKTSGLPSNRVMGMAGVLDTARYRAFLSMELNVSPRDIQAVLMGGHGDTMVPLPRYTTVSGIPVTELIEKDRLDAIIDRTKSGGGELVALMGTSAWYAPGSAAAQMAAAIIRDEQRILPVCAYLQGQYGINDLYLGVPVKLGLNGVEQIIELQLTDDEKALLNDSAEAVRSVVEAYNAMATA